jgi:membrane protease YdiL (CAAX protease family)
MLRCLEFAVLFVALPTIYWLRWIPLPMIPFLLLVAACCFAILWRDGSFDRGRLWNRRALKTAAPGIVRTFAIAALIMAFVVALLLPERLFAILRERPLLWAAIMIFYPLFSVYPQELIYRTFLFHRYEPIFRTAWLRVGASAVSFGYMHIVFENLIAVVMTVAGGFLFALTYERSRSTLLVSFEHALYGCFVFTIGLGAYFYGGNVR